MRNKPVSGQFDLEALEPRVLLSADPCVLAPATCTEAPTAIVINEQPTSATSDAGSSVAYDCAAQVNDIFGEAGDDDTHAVAASASPYASPSPAEGGTANTGNEQAPAVQAQDVQQGTSSTSGQAVGNGSSNVTSGSTENANPFPEQLVETLRAANAPPDSSSSTQTAQSITQSGSSSEGHYTGIRLNGVPYDPASDVSITGNVFQIGTGNVLSGNGLVGKDLIVNGTISPGNSPGLLQTGSQNWLASTFPYDWEINDALGNEGVTNAGWDFEKIIPTITDPTGVLNIVATAVNPATIRVKSLLPSNAAGALTNFNSANPYTWRILSTTTGITGFSRDVVKLDTTGFTSYNSLGSGDLVLDISDDGRDLLVRFVPTQPNLSLNQPVWVNQGPDYMTGGHSVIPPDDPATGAVQTIVLQPGKPSVAWMGAVNGGLWLSTDFNLANPTWTPLAQDLPSLAVSTLAISPFDITNASVGSGTPLSKIVLYMGTGMLSSAHDGGRGVGLFRSVDGGTTWTKVGKGLDVDGLPLTAIVASSAAPGVVYAGTSLVSQGRGGLYRSSDRGDNWVRLSGTGGLPDFGVSDLAHEPVSINNISGRFYVALAGEGGTALNTGVFLTDNNGANWANISTGIKPDWNHNGNRNEGELLEQAVRIRLAVSQTTGNVYTAVVGNKPEGATTDRGLSGVFQSPPGGGSWTVLSAIDPVTNTGGQGAKHFGLAVDLGDRVYVGGDRVAVGADFVGPVFRWDGTWTQLTYSSGNYQTAPHPDIRNLVFDVGNNGLLALTDGGLYFLSNPINGGGTQWDFNSQGVNVAEITSVTYDHNTNTVIAGLQDNGVMAQQQSSTDWYALLGGDGNFVGVTYSGNISTRFYMGKIWESIYRQNFNQFDVPQTSPTHILLKSIDPALTANYSGLDSSLKIGKEEPDDESPRGPVALNAVDSNRLALGRFALYTSSNRGDTIAQQNFKTVGILTALAYGGRFAGSNNADIIWAARGAEVLLSLDDGCNFQNDLALGGAHIFQIAMDPENWHTAFAVDDKHIYLLTADANGVPTSVDITGNLGSITNASFRSIEVANIGGQLVVLVGARDGVYRLRVGDVNSLNADPDTYAYWSRFGIGLPNVQVADLQYDAVANVLIAGTRGRGAWKITNASSALLAEPVLRFESNGGNQQVRLVLTPLTVATPRLLQVYNNNTLQGTFPLTNILKISVHLGQNTDRLIVDSTNGEVAIPRGIEFDGGDGNDTLEFLGSVSSALESAAQGPVQIRQSGREKVFATNVETFTDNTTAQSFFDGVRNAFQSVSDWFSRLKNLGNGGNAQALPLLGNALGTGLNGGQFRAAEGAEDEASEAGDSSLGETNAVSGSFLTRLFKEGPGAFSISDIGTFIITNTDLQNKLDALDNIPGNVTVDGIMQKIVLGDPTDPNKPFKRTLSFHAPIDATLLGGLIEIHGTLDLSAEIDLMMEIGVDPNPNSRGFYVRTNLTPQPEITIRNIVVDGELEASGTFGIVDVDLNDATLTLDPDVKITIDLVEPTDPYGHIPDNKLRVYEFGNNPGALLNIAIIGDPLQDDLTLQGDFTLSVAGGNVPEPFLNLGTIQLALIWGDINDLTSLRVDASASPAADILMRFLNMDRDQLLGEFQRLMDTLDQLGDSDLLDVKIPFGNGTKLRDAIDFSQAFLNKVYDKLIDVDLTGGTQINVGNIKQGKLNADAKFTVDAEGATSPLITVTAASTANNNSLKDLADDINAAIAANAPAFASKVHAEAVWGNIRFHLFSSAKSVKISSSDPNNPMFTQLGFTNNQPGTDKLKVPTLQSLMRRIKELFPSLVLNLVYDQINKRMSWHLQFNYTLPTQTTNFAYDTNFNLGSLAEASFSGTLSINGNVTGNVAIDLTLGIDFGALRAPKLLGSYLIPPPSNGHLTSDSNFVINVNDGTRYSISVTAAQTAGFTQLKDLVDLLNSKLAPYNFITGNGPVSLNTVIRFIQSRDALGNLLPGIRLETINEDLDADGNLDVSEDINLNGKLDPGEDVDNDRHLDVNEDKVYLLDAPQFVNNTLDSNLGRIRSISIQANANDPIYNEVGFPAPVNTSTTAKLFNVARAAVKGLYIENTVLTASATVSATNLAASARLALFGLSMNGGTATGTANMTLNLVNPLGGTRIRLGQLLGDLRHLKDYIGLNFIWNASLDIHLPNLAVTPSIFGNLIPAGAEVRIFVPDLHYVTYNPNPYDPVTNKQGLFVTYPQFGPLFDFNCMSATDFIIALKSLSTELTKFKAFDFLNKPLPLINISISQVIDFAANLAQTIQGLATGNAKTLDLLEAKIESLLGIPGNDLNFSVEYTTVTEIPNTPVYLWNPTGQNNALRFTATGNQYNGVTFKLVDDGTLASGANVATVDNYNATNKIVTIHYNATYTTAATIRTAVHNKFLANNVTMPFDATLDSADVGNDGSGTVHETALKMELSYHVAYGNSLPFALGLGDLVDLLPLNSPVRTFLANVADFFTTEISGNVNVNAAADLKLVFGLDVSNPCGWKPFFYDGPTGTNIDLTASVSATNLTFVAGVGAINIQVKNGTATLNSDGLTGSPPASFAVTLKDSNGDGRHYVRSSETFFNTNNIGINLTAGASAVLPIYLLGGTIPLGNQGDTNGDGFADNALVVLIPSFKRLFFPEKTDNSNQATLTSPGANNDLLFTGSGPDRQVKIINVSGAPSASLNGTRLEVNINSLITTAQQVTGLTLPAGWSATYEGNGSGAVYADLTIIAPNIASLFTGFNPCDLVKNASMLLDGLDGLLGTIQNGLANNVLNKVLPLVGNKLGQAADFIEKFRNGLLANIRAKLVQAGDPIGLVKEAIFKSLGKDGLDILVKSDDSPINTPEDIEIECTGSAIDFKIHLKKDLAFDTSAHPINFDIGIPALGLAVNGNVKVQIGFDLKLYFGISAADGFYFDTSSAEELRVNFKVTIPGLHVKGSLLWLQLDVSDDPNDPSSFEGYFTVDVHGPTSHPNRLKASDFKSSTFKLADAFSAEMGAVADVNLDMALSLQGNVVLPRLLAEFNLDWKWTLGGDENGELEMGFHNIQLDAGAFISKFVKPILEKIQVVTKPLQPVIDMLTTPIPILSDLAHEPIDMLKLAQLFGFIKPGTEEFIRDVAEIITIINDTSYSDNGSVLIPLGDFELQTDGLGNVDRKAGDPDPEPAALSNGTSDSGTKGFLARLEDRGWKFPFLKVSELFKLFTGQPVTIVEYHMPVLEFKTRYEGKIPIYPPLYAVLGAQAGVKIDLTFGFDTYGLQKYFSSSDKKKSDIFDGFFVKDVNDKGVDIPEVVLTGGLYAGAELDFGVAEVGVTGGLYAEIDFNLNDPDDDGKVRLSELIANAKQDILCIFDITGEVFVKLTAFFKVDLLDIDLEWDFGKKVLLSFELTCPVPVLADVTGGVLRLNMGPRAADRIEGDIEDGDETFIVKHISGDGTSTGNNPTPEVVEVSFNGISQTYKGVTSIVADGGEGNDTIDLRGILSPATVTGGNGNDAIYAGRVGRLPGTDQLIGSIYYGNAGNDRIVGALRKDFPTALSPDLNDEFHGGDGNDTLIGNEGDDLLYGDAGNDTLNGNDGDDQIWGADGADTITGDAGADIIDAGTGNDRITGGIGNDNIIAFDGADYVDAGDGDDWVDGGNGADNIIAGNGNDYVDAGPGNDRIFGGRGDDQLIGGDNNDYIDGGSGSDIIIGDLGTISAPPNSLTTFPVTVLAISGTGNDVIIGGAAVDVIFAAGGNDKIFGGALLTNGQNQVSGTNPSEYYDGADFIDAGEGNDVVFADDAHGSPSTVYPGATISGSAWFDIADVYAVVNNVRDPGENGLANVSVELHKLNTVLVGTTTTDANGNFTFSGLDAGDYYLVFSLPTGLTYATQNVGSDDTIDSDVDGTGKTGTIHVDEGASDTTHAAGYHGTNPQISINDQSIVEGTGGLTDLIFTVTLSNPSSTLVSVCYDSSSGFGPHGADRILDFQSVSGTLVFQPGETTKTIAVAVVGDDIYEGDYETFTVSLSLPHNSAIDPMHATGTGSIIDDDTVPVVRVENTRNDEGNTLAFVVSLSNASKFSVSVEYMTAQTVNPDGTLVADGAIATLDYDPTYELTPGLIVFSPGQTEQTVFINTAQDPLDEYDERMNLIITLDPTMPNNQATLGRNVALGFILDDDATPYVRIAPISQTIIEGHAGFTPVPLVIGLYDPITNLPTVSGRPVTVTWDTTSGTAAVAPGLGGDAEYIFNSVTFAPQTNTYVGDSQLNISVNIVGDTRYEPQVNSQWEYFFVNLLQATNGVLDARDVNLNHSTVFIQDDEVLDPGPWYVQFDRTNYFVKEGQTLTVTLVAAEDSSFAMAVYWTIGGAGIGVATPTSDYTPVWENGTAGNSRQMVRFAGRTTLTFTIPTVQDTTYEGDEVFNLYLANPTGGMVRAPNQIATVTIVEDDPLPHIKISDASGSESSPPLHFTVTATGDSAVPVTVNWAAYNGSAKAPGDFVPTGGSFVIMPFGGTYTVPVAFEPQVMGSSRVDLQACKLEYSIVSPK